METSRANAAADATLIIHDAGLRGPERGSSCSDMKEVPTGCTFEIILKSNLQGGYLWYFQGDKTNAMFSFVKDYQEPLPRYGGTRQHFVFRAADSAGVGLIPFGYKRIWEDSNYATFDMTVRFYSSSDGRQGSGAGRKWH